MNVQPGVGRGGNEPPFQSSKMAGNRARLTERGDIHGGPIASARLWATLALIIGLISLNLLGILGAFLALCRLDSSVDVVHPADRKSVRFAAVLIGSAGLVDLVYALLFFSGARGLSEADRPLIFGAVIAGTIILALFQVCAGVVCWRTTRADEPSLERKLSKAQTRPEHGVPASRV